MIEIPRPPAVKDPAEYTTVWSSVREDVIRILERRPTATFRGRPADGSWSAAELAEHLQLTQFFFARSVPICLRGKFGYDMNPGSAGDYELFFERVSQSRGIKNPAAVGPSGQWDLDTCVEKLNLAQTTMEKNLAGVPIEKLRRRGYEHPIYGPVSLLDWVWILTLHENAHRMTMREKFGED